MKALVLRGPYDIAVEERPEPQPKPGEVVVEVIATGICGSDFHGYSGENGRRHPGQVMGHETVGRVDELGPGVTDLAPGSAYGLGVSVVKDATTNCVTALSHTGAEPGYVTSLVAFPTSGAVFALQANGDGGDAEHALNLIFKPLVDVVLPVASTPPTQSCVPPSPTSTSTPTTAVVPVGAAPRFTG